MASYVRVLHWKKFKLRNILDMRAGFGGYFFNLILHCAINILVSVFLKSIVYVFLCRFAAALIDNLLDAWVLNVVPISGSNTLPVIYDRGLIGVMHDWYFFLTMIPIRKLCVVDQIGLVMAVLSSMVFNHS